MQDEEDADVVAGPELPSDQDEEVVDDDEGRFFGGGITNDTAEVLDFIDEQDKDHLRVRPSCAYFEVCVSLTETYQKPEKIDSAWLRKVALNFEKKISRNAELRAKFEDTPQKYVRTVYTDGWVFSDLCTQVHGLRSRSRCGYQGTVNTF